MTPKEMRAMTARMNSAHVPAYALREDLKVALTELSELQDAYREVTNALKERAERAEAEAKDYLHALHVQQQEYIERSEAELIAERARREWSLNEHYKAEALREMHRAERAEAALDRVRDLCDSLETRVCDMCGTTDCPSECYRDSQDWYCTAADIRAALDGGDR